MHVVAVGRIASQTPRAPQDEKKAGPLGGLQLGVEFWKKVSRVLPLWSSVSQAGFLWTKQVPSDL